MRFRIPKQEKPIKERIDVKLERGLLQTLDEYCQFMESDRDYVVGTVLALVFKRDKGFTAWRMARGTSTESAPRQARA